MVSLFALYRRPQDEAEFLAHYEMVHVPLANRMPHLLSITWGRPESLDGPDSDLWFLVAEMRFDNRDAMTAALHSPWGQAAGQDIQQFAPGLLTMRMVEWQ